MALSTEVVLSKTLATSAISVVPTQEQAETTEPSAWRQASETASATRARGRPVGLEPAAFRTETGRGSVGAPTACVLSAMAYEERSLYSDRVRTPISQVARNHHSAPSGTMLSTTIIAARVLTLGITLADMQI